MRAIFRPFLMGSFLSAGLLGAALLGGCGGEGLPEGQQADAQQSVQADGLMNKSFVTYGCGTVYGYPYAGPAADGTSQEVNPAPHCGIAFNTANSPTVQYDNGPTCSGEYILEVRDTLNMTLNASMTWLSPGIPNQAQCSQVAGEVLVFGRQADGSWVELGDDFMSGTWIAGLGCQVSQPAVPVLTGEKYDAVRVVGHGHIGALGARVGLALKNGTGPC